MNVAKRPAQGHGSAYIMFSGCSSLEPSREGNALRAGPGRAEPSRAPSCRKNSSQRSLHPRQAPTGVLLVSLDTLLEYPFIPQWHTPCGTRRFSSSSPLRIMGKPSLPPRQLLLVMPRSRQERTRLAILAAITRQRASPKLAMFAPWAKKEIS